MRRRIRDNVIAVVALVVVLALATVAQLFYFTGGPGTPDAPSRRADARPRRARRRERRATCPSADLAEDRTWTGTLTLNDIPLGIELDGAAAPQASSRAVSLVADGLLRRHDLPPPRPRDEHLGCCSAATPTATATGGPGYSYGPIENAPADGVYPAGTIAMARQAANAYSQGSQFFIVYEDTTLPADAAGGYTVVGTVTERPRRSSIDGDHRRRHRPTARTDGAPARARDDHRVHDRVATPRVRPLDGAIGRCNRLDAASRRVEAVRPTTG